MFDEHVVVVDLSLVFQYAFTHASSALAIAYENMGSLEIRCDGKYKCYFNNCAIVQTKKKWSRSLPAAVGGV